MPNADLKNAMNWFRGFSQRRRTRDGKMEAGADLDAELRSHLEMQTQENLEAGMSPAEARRAALRDFGWVEKIKDDCRDQRGERWLDRLLQDGGYALRLLRKQPGFAAAAVLTLALGIGANTAIFSVIRAVLLRPPPYGEPGRIMVLWADNPAYNLGIHELPPSQRDVLDWREQAGSFEEVAGISSTTQDLDEQGDRRRIGAVSITANLFAALGVQPALGRNFSVEEEQPGKDKVVILSDALWRRSFRADPSIVGGKVTLNGGIRTVVGVMPPGFSFPHAAELPTLYAMPGETEAWLPVAQDAGWWQDDVNRQFIVIGRLKPGRSPGQAQAELDAIAQRAGQARAATHAGWVTHLRPLARQIAGRTRPALFLLLGAVALLLLIACANVANLLLCRSAARRREMAIRAAVGAGRARVLRQLLTESLVLALAGGLAGFVLGAAGLKALLAFSPPDIPRLHEATLDGWLLAFSLATSLVTGVVFGFVPAWHASKPNLTDVLNTAGRGNAEGGGLAGHRSLVAAEVAIASLLLVGAALMMQSFQRLAGADTGFAKSGLHSFELTMRGERYATGESRIALLQILQDRLTALPGVRAAAATSHLPLGGSENVGYLTIEGLPAPPAGKEPVAESRLVTRDYFAAMGVGLVRGRGFDSGDREGSLPVAIVNETFTRRFLPGGEPLGKRVKLNQDGPEWLTIVGVVRDLHEAALDAEPLPGIYRPHAQAPLYWDAMTLVARTTDEARNSTLEAAFRRELKAVDPGLTAARYRRVETLLATAVARPRFSSLLLAVFAGTALLLTLVGLYGVVAFAVGRRTRELGIRMALGAQRRDVVALVVRQGMAPALAGLGLGLAVALGAGRLLTAQLFGIQATDPATFAAVTAVIAGVALIACWAPARRAALVDPMTSLRAD